MFLSDCQKRTIEFLEDRDIKEVIIRRLGSSKSIAIRIDSGAFLDLSCEQLHGIRDRIMQGVSGDLIAGDKCSSPPPIEKYEPCNENFYLSKSKHFMDIAYKIVRDCHKSGWKEDGKQPQQMANAFVEVLEIIQHGRDLDLKSKLEEALSEKLKKLNET